LVLAWRARVSQWLALVSRVMLWLDLALPESLLLVQAYPVSSSRAPALLATGSLGMASVGRGFQARSLAQECPHPGLEYSAALV
jgi:hypothetical protein